MSHVTPFEAQPVLNQLRIAGVVFQMKHAKGPCHVGVSASLCCVYSLRRRLPGGGSLMMPQNEPTCLTASTRAWKFIGLTT